ncbi:MAG: hypothetical protein EZS28_022430, partial [Streblomastix strix]
MATPLQTLFGEWPEESIQIVDGNHSIKIIEMDRSIGSDISGWSVKSNIQKLFNLLLFELLSHLSLTSYEKTTTINLLKQYLSGYSFIDTSLAPYGPPDGYGQHAVDINKGLDAILTNSSYNCTFDFYEDIMVLLGKLKDPHTIFRPPCVRNVWYILCPLQLHKNATDGTYYVTSSNYVIQYVNIKGLPIFKNGNELNDGTMTPIEALMKFADEEEPISKSPVVRLYRATKQSFYQRSALQFRHPENSQITLSYLSNGESQTLTYNVYVYMGESIGNLADLCPIHPDYTLNADQIQKNSLVVDTEEEQRKLAEEYQLRLDEQQIRMTHELEEQIRPQPLIPHPEINIEQFEQQYNEFWEDEELIEDLQDKYEQKQQKDKIGDTAVEKQVNENQIHEKKYQQEKETIKQIQKETQQTNPNETEYEDGVIIPHKGRLRMKTRSNEDTNYQYWNPYPASGTIQLQAYRLTSRQVGILYIGTFGPSDQDAFANYIFMYIREFTDTSSQYHCDRLILDVQGNSGGLIRCGRFALNLIFSQVGFPLYQIADTIKTELNIEMEKIDIFSTRFNYNQSEIASWVKNLTQKPNFYSIGSRTRKTVDVNDQSRWMTVNITDPYVFSLSSDLKNRRYQKKQKLTKDKERKKSAPQTSANS